MCHQWNLTFSTLRAGRLLFYGKWQHDVKHKNVCIVYVCVLKGGKFSCVCVFLVKYLSKRDFSYTMLWLRIKKTLFPQRKFNTTIFISLPALRKNLGSGGIRTLDLLFTRQAL